MMESLSTPSTTSQLSRDRILDATLRNLREQGYDATTIRRIASRLDCAIGSIYRYFKDKHELLLAVTERIIEPIAEAIDAGQPFEQTIDLYTQTAGADRQAYGLMFWLVRSQAVPDNQTEPQSETADAALPAVVSRIIDGWARQLGDTRTALRCWAMLHGSIVAGLDSAAIRDELTAVIGQSTTEEREDVAMAQIVSLLRRPAQHADTIAPQGEAATSPAPQAVASVPTQVAPSAELTPPPKPGVTVPPEYHADDDVCLL